MLFKSLQDFKKQEIMACSMLFKSLYPFVYLRETLHALSACMGKGASSKDIRTHKFFIMGLTSQKQAKDIRLIKTLFLYLVFTRNVTPKKDMK